MGKLIVFEGLDGCGKATQKSLMDYDMTRNHIKHDYVSFPEYDKDSSFFVKKYLNGDFGKSPYDVNSYAATVFFLTDQFISYKTRPWGKFYDDGGLIISDRYFTSNLIYQGCKLYDHENEDPQEVFRFTDYINDFAYHRIGIPEPDFVFYLKIHPEVSIANMNKRYHNDESKKDINEADTEYLFRTHKVANLIAEREGWYPIPVSVIGSDGIPHMRDAQEIHKQIVEMMRDLKLLRVLS